MAHPLAIQPKTPWQRFGVWGLGVLGWTGIMAPPPGQKFILVGYPHTSNWDFLYAILWGMASGTRFRWVGKKQLFPPVLGGVMRGLGGIPVDRGKAGSDFVTQVANIFTQFDNLWVIVAAEGTRSRAEHWKTGFYYMALEAKVPIALGYLDYSKKEVGVGAYLMPTGDIQADFKQLKDFFADKVGKDPSKQGPVALKPKEPQLPNT